MNSEPIRVAHIMGKMMSGGVESVVMNYYQHIDKEKVQFDFIVDEDSTYIPHEEIELMGGRVIIVPPYQKIFSYINNLMKILKENNYKIVHSHLNAMSIFPLYAAKRAGVSIRIAHSHSTSNKTEWKKNLLKNILKKFSKTNATHYFCCSELAGRWLFGDKVYNQNKVIKINNAIDMDKFIYNSNINTQMREELGISKDALVIGHIGRFMKQKNHEFLIDIFNEIYIKNNNAVLVLVGDGPLQEQIEKRVKKLNIESAVRFLGVRKDINKIYQIMDIFLFPSLYEGLGMVLIEAQIAGLACITSTEVPREVDISGRVSFISLSLSAKKWAGILMKNLNEYNQNKPTNVSLKSNYDIKVQSIKLQKIYTELYNKHHKEME